MRSRTDVGASGSKGYLDVEVPRGTSTTTRPDPEAPAIHRSVQVSHPGRGGRLPGPW